MIYYGTKLIGGVGIVEETVTPTPPGPEYEYICPQSLGYGDARGYPNPVLLQSKNKAVATMCYPQSLIDEEGDGTILIIDKNHAQTQSIITLGYITEELIQQQKMALANESSDRHMTQETEDWLRERIGWLMTTVHEAHYGIARMKDYQKYMIIGTSGKTFESKMGYVVQ